MTETPTKITSEESYTAGKVIYEKGEPAEHTYLLKSGVVELLDEKGKCARKVRSGQVFGESALVSSEAKRMHTARVLEESGCLKIARQPLEDQLSREDPFIAALFRILQGNMCNVMQMKKMPKEELSALAKELAESSK